MKTSFLYRYRLIDSIWLVHLFPGVFSAGTNQEVYIFLNSVGVQPFMILNILINEERDENPQLRATSVMEFSGVISSSAAFAIRFWFTYL